MLKPHWFAAIYWTALLTLTYFLFPEGYRSVGATLYLGAILACFVLGAAFGYVWEPRKRWQVGVTDSRLLRIVAYMGGGAALVATVLVLLQAGVSVNSVFSYRGLLRASNAMATTRYSGTTYASAASSLAMAIAYTGALVAPFAFEAKNRFRAGIPLVGVAVYSAVTTERLPLLIAFAFVAGGLVASRARTSGRFPKLRLRMAVAAALIGVLAAGLFVSVAVLRVGGAQSLQAQVLDKQATYAFGSVPAFSVWYDGRSPEELPLGYGAASFGVIGPAVGRDPRAYRSYDSYAQITADGRHTNVYTIVRGLVLDFTESGALLAATLVGFGLGAVGRRTIAGSLPAAGLLAAGYGSVLLSNTSSIFMFTNVSLSVLMAWWVLRVAWRTNAAGPQGVASDARSSPTSMRGQVRTTH
jgi:oligosaccharide repeat unit polymerase